MYELLSQFDLTKPYDSDEIESKAQVLVKGLEKLEKLKDKEIDETKIDYLYTVAEKALE